MSTKYADLCKAAEKSLTDKEQEVIWKTNNEPYRQRFVGEVFSDLCSHLNCPTENVKWIDMKQDLIIHGSIADSLPSLEYPKDDQAAPAGEIGLFLSGIEITLKHGKGDSRFQFSFHHMNTGGPGSIIFRGNMYELADHKRDFFDALSAAIAEELNQPNVKSPNKKFFRN